jgi:hypothetical protein
MKPKLLLCLALVLSGGLFNFASTARCAGVKNAYEPWVSETNTIYYCTEIPSASIQGKRSTYQFQINSNQFFDIPVSIFTNEKTGHIWAGRSASFYIETDSCIFGLTLVGGALRYEKSWNVKITDKEEAEALEKTFERQFDPSILLRPSWPVVDLRRILNPWFFTAVPMGSQPGKAKIQRIRTEHKQLQLDLVSPTGMYKASVWINLVNWEVIKAVENGKPVYPK